MSIKKRKKQKKKKKKKKKNQLTGCVSSIDLGS